jgi:hypothetical protein
VPKDTAITYSLRDYFGVGIDSTSINTVVGGINAILHGVFQAPFSGSITPVTGGYDVSILGPVDYISYAEISVFVSATDLNTNYNDYSWMFRIEDYIPPSFDTPYPPPATFDIDKNTLVSFNATDVAGSGVNPNGINVTLTWPGSSSSALVNGVFQAGYSGTITPDGSGGYAVSFNRSLDYPSFAEITVNCDVDDLEFNNAVTSWTFRTEDYLGAYVNDISPLPGSSGVDRNTNISFRIADEQPIVLDSIKVEVDITGTGSGYITAFEHEAFVSPFNGPLSSYDASDPADIVLVIDPEFKLPKFALILVRVYADDAEGNPIRM